MYTRNYLELEDMMNSRTWCQIISKKYSTENHTVEYILQAKERRKLSVKRQRSKAELLNILRTHQALKKEQEQGTELNRQTVYFRMGVEWSVVLWKEEKFSTNEIAKFLQYIADHVMEMTEQRGEEIRGLLDDKVDWTLKNTVVMRKNRSVIDQEYNELEYYNTQVSVDYSLLACEYLIKQKGYAKKRLNRVIGDVYFLENLSAKEIWNMRQDLFDNKGIWIDLDGSEPPEDAMVIK